MAPGSGWLPPAWRAMEITRASLLSQHCPVTPARSTLSPTRCCATWRPTLAAGSSTASECSLCCGTECGTERTLLLNAASCTPDLLPWLPWLPFATQHRLARCRRARNDFPSEPALSAANGRLNPARRGQEVQMQKADAALTACDLVQHKSTDHQLSVSSQQCCLLFQCHCSPAGWGCCLPMLALVCSNGPGFFS